MSAISEGEEPEDTGHLVGVLDANVLYPAQLRDLLIRLAVARLMRAHWTDLIHAEWMRAVGERHPDISPRQLRRTQELMDQALPTAKVSGYNRRIKQLSLPDSEDRHVVAAALKAGATIIVTFNIRHFPAEALDPHGLKALHPDIFVRLLYDHDSDGVIDVVRKHRASLRRPPLDTDSYLFMLEKAGLQQSVDALRRHKALI